MAYGYIYKCTLKPTGKIYVGKREKSKFDSSYYGGGNEWRRVISNYNKDDDIDREVLEWCESREELLKKEVEWIQKLNARDPNIGYNVSKGGECGLFGCSIKHTKQWNENIGRGNRGKVYSEQSRKNMSDGCKKYWRDNKEARINLSNHKKRLMSDETWYNNFCESMRNRFTSEEYREKFETNVWSKRRDSREVICVETGEVFKNHICADKWLLKTKNIKSSVRRVLLGARKTCGGYHWEYK